MLRETLAVCVDILYALSSLSLCLQLVLYFDVLKINFMRIKNYITLTIL